MSPPLPVQPARVLVAEDDPVARLAILTVLQEAGYAAFSVRDGKVALDALEDNPHLDLLVTDIIMPELDGRDLVRAVRAHPRLAHLPVVMVSSAVGVREIKSLLKDGVSLFLGKPVAREALLEAVDRLLRQRQDQLGASS